MTATETVYAGPEASDAGASMYVVYQPTEELLEALAAPTVTANAVLEYLHGECEALMADRRRDDIGFSPPRVDDFFSESDLSIYADAMAWWPRVEGMPPQFAAPSIYQLIWRYHDHSVGGTFVERLTIRAHAAQAWLTANGLDHPNESKADRAKRLNAEAQARHRARRSGTQGAAAADAVASAYRRYMDVCLERKAAKAEVDAEWGPKVHAARVAWEAAKKNPPSTEAPDGVVGTIELPELP